VLQRSLLPAQLPVVPGLDLASRYLPAENGGISGDWYDIFTLPSSWLCIVIGDVVGRGLGAADVTGRIRNALRAYALLGGDPAEVLGRVDQQMQHFDSEAMATVLLAVFEHRLSGCTCLRRAIPRRCLPYPISPRHLSTYPVTMH
jgi:serine phosphatase RsbU (regulator of sigma subunit)